MKIKLYQSGGFAGEQIKLKEVSDKELSPEKKAGLQALLTKAGLDTESRHNSDASTPEGFDFLQYELSVSNEKGETTFRFPQSTNSQPLVELVDFIKGL